ncbi:hypothetical protein HanXRQr2_Chr09g0382831 [Helianthus annuus]|uniref:Uncharacterized protein n=1 Tax=Helianthus annuus TaxID=4232 RepID=A0A9K3I4Q0_HELAN|nr:hypothetical protein HanXRQr2_Chr09g0382831 [Helianthus annuus]
MIRLKAWPPPVVAQLLDQEVYLVEMHHCEFMSPFSLNCFQFSKLRG